LNQGSGGDDKVEAADKMSQWRWLKQLEMFFDVLFIMVSDRLCFEVRVDT